MSHPTVWTCGVRVAGNEIEKKKKMEHLLLNGRHREKKVIIHHFSIQHFSAHAICMHAVTPWAQLPIAGRHCDAWHGRILHPPKHKHQNETNWTIFLVRYFRFNSKHQRERHCRWISSLIVRKSKRDHIAGWLINGMCTCMTFSCTPATQRHTAHRNCNINRMDKDLDLSSKWKEQEKNWTERWTCTYHLHSISRKTKNVERGGDGERGGKQKEKQS